jgi:hypothetical protein
VPVTRILRRVQACQAPVRGVAPSLLHQCTLSIPILKIWLNNVVQDVSICKAQAVMFSPPPLALRQSVYQSNGLKTSTRQTNSDRQPQSLLERSQISELTRAACKESEDHRQRRSCWGRPHELSIHQPNTSKAFRLTQRCPDCSQREQQLFGHRTSWS